MQLDAEKESKESKAENRRTEKNKRRRSRLVQKGGGKLPFGQLDKKRRTRGSARGVRRSVRAGGEGEKVSCH